MIVDAIKKAVAGHDLDEAEAASAMTEIMEGQATPAQIAAYLTALRIKGETIDEIAGSAKVMREKATKVPHKQSAVCDTCGTGGDNSGSFNISTTAAFVVAGAGVAVAKHGNKAMTSQSGSADVLAALGVNVELEPEAVGRCIDEAGIGFLFAMKLHGAMKHAGPVRREIGIRTIFNLLGPLTNPAGAKRQVIGVFDGDFAEKMASALGRLGMEHAFVVHGEDGLDEITLTGDTRVAELKNGKVKSFYLNPEEYGLDLCQASALKGGTAAENAVITRAVLGGEKGPRRDIVAINAAAAICAAGKSGTIKEGLDLARLSLDSGSALGKLEKLVKVSNS